MSFRVMDAFIYDKSEDELIVELNSIRKDYIEFAKDYIKKNATHLMQFGKSYFKRFAKPDDINLEIAIRTVGKGSNSLERGMPSDFSGNCVIVKHKKKIVLWFFTGFIFDQFKRKNPVYKRIFKNEYGYCDSGDCEFETKEEKRDWKKRGNFWHEVFDKYDTSIPANVGLSYEFFRHDDIFELGCTLEHAYEETINLEKK